ncbi:MAG: transposase [Planctomycetia bacterium]|nr:transposase [Planctomycetia bacterium]
MPNYRRLYVPGGTYFFTVVTAERMRILTVEPGLACLHEAIDEISRKRPFEMVAYVWLPDHLHTVWTLPQGDDEYSLRWSQIKEAFTRRFLGRNGIEAPLSASRIKHRERGVWQRRFWEHTCRDEDDLKRLVDYVHWNPRKHGLVDNVIDWPWSSFHRFVELGEYDKNWGASDPCPDWHDPEWE